MLFIIFRLRAYEKAHIFYIKRHSKHPVKYASLYNSLIKAFKVRSWIRKEYKNKSQSIS